MQPPTGRLGAGFSLTELLIVLAIVGVMAAVAIPTYQNFVLRAQVTEALQLATPLRNGVAEYLANTGNWPRGVKELGLSEYTVGNRVVQLHIEQGTVVATFGGASPPRLNGKTLVLRPGLLGGRESEQVVWQCGNEVLARKGLEVDFGGTQEAQTTIENGLLPSECRSP